MKPTSGTVVRAELQPGFSRSQSKMPKSMDHHICHPDEFLRLPVTGGMSWSGPSFAYGPERMTASVTVERVDESAVVPAGTHDGCVLIRTDFRREGEDPSESHRRLKLRNSGTRYQWYAPGVLALTLTNPGAVRLHRRSMCENNTWHASRLRPPFSSPPRRPAAVAWNATAGS